MRKLREKNQKHINFATENNIGIIKLNRPEKLNAFSDIMIELFLEKLVEWEFDKSIRVVVITGEEPGFCSGGDLESIKNSIGDNVQESENYIKKVIQAVPKKLYHYTKPTIAAINGIAAGGGLDFALSCDIRTAHEKATFTESYVKLGLLPGAGGSWLLPRIVNKSIASELLLTGKTINSIEAYRIGLISHVWPEKTFWAETMKIANTISRNPSYSVQNVKHLIKSSSNTDFDTHLAEVAAYIAIAKTTPEHKSIMTQILKKKTE